MILKSRILYLSLFIVCILAGNSKSYGETSFDLMFNSTNNYKDVVVQEVINVDEIIIENYLKKGEKIKLIGLRAPKIETRRKKIDRDKNGFIIEEKVETATSVEEQALAYVKELLENEHVRLEFDSSKRDDNFNTVAYVHIIEGNIFANFEILRNGYAYLRITPPNTKYAGELRQAYKEARDEKRGFQGQ